MPIAYSLHIGVDNYDTKFYPESVNRLNGCINDMHAMRRMAIGMGVKDNTDYCRFKADATKLDLHNDLTYFAGEAQPDDFFLFTFAGHGFQKKDLYGDEPDGANEHICLRNGPVIDNDINLYLAKFNERVRIVCLFDSCHSGSAIRFSPGNEPPRSAAGWVLSCLRYLLGLRPRGLTVKEEKDVLSRSNLPAFGPHKKRKKGLAAIGLSISACGDGPDELAYERGGRGLFTKAVEDCFYGGGRKLTYQGFHQRLLDSFESEHVGKQKPTLLPFQSQFEEENKAFRSNSFAFTF